MAADADRPTTTSEERLWASLGHFSGVLMAAGVVVPAIVWATQREKSRFVTFQAIQAIAYQILFFLAYLTITICLALTMSAVLIALVAANPRIDPESFIAFPLVQFGFMGFIFLALGVSVLISLIAGGLCLSGNNFRYPILGAWLERYLEQSTESEAA
jgi:uncharacterized Tic20 family protein